MLRIGLDNLASDKIPNSPPRRHCFIRPLDRLVVTGIRGASISVRDGADREYARTAASPEPSFTVAGALGPHTVSDLDTTGHELAHTTFSVDAHTTVEDGGRFGDLFRLLDKGMCVYDPDGTGSVTWNGRTYRCFVSWLLDQFHTQKGMQYFEGCAADMVDLFRETQHPSGMIWSFVQQVDPAYFETAYGPYGYFGPKSDTAFFARQPSENHVEYIYVNMLYLSWKANGDDEWMQRTLDTAARALDYVAESPARWSQRFQLLKRPYTIDSWDFQVDDDYLPDFGIGRNMVIDPQKTKFGIFYGDNTGYAEACDQLAEMMDRLGRSAGADRYRTRGREIRERLNALAWNGHFFTHFIEEDPAVHRDLGVDASSQISLSNTYSINRGLPHDQCVAIIRTYLSLKDHLPIGSAGEWYAIYPPFQRGFSKHTEKELWQYMNGGVAGHAAGELARGSFEHGFEHYGVDILERLLDLGKKHGGRIWFAYTGCIPPAPPGPRFTSISLDDAANMDLWDKGAEGVPEWMSAAQPGNDMRGIPTGLQTFAGIPFIIPDPEKNHRRGAAAVSRRPGYPQQIKINILDQAHTVYLLHTAGNIGSAGIAGAITFEYDDGTQTTLYLVNGKHLGGWWFPQLKTDTSGVAWRGPSPRSTAVGVCWAALENPYPDRVIRSLSLEAAADGAIYALLGLALADKPHFVPPKVESYGGPDNWAAGTAMAALVEGLAGVRDQDTRYREARIAPRWIAAGVENAEVRIRYAASDGYVAYQYRHDPEARQITLSVAGSGDTTQCHILLPSCVDGVSFVQVDGKPVRFDLSRVENSFYVDFEVAIAGARDIVITYQGTA